MADLITGLRELIRESRVAACRLPILYNYLFLNIFIRSSPLNTALQPPTTRWAYEIEVKNGLE